MNSLLDHLHLAFFGLQPWMTSIVVPVAAIIFWGVYTVCSMYFNHRKQELWHQTARIALEKGQPVPGMTQEAPPEVAKAPSSNPRERWRSYLIAGLINVGVGAGLFVALSQITDARFNVGYFGCIPGFIGVALLIGAAVEAMVSRNQK